jgi:hypothetical protein
MTVTGSAWPAVKQRSRKRLDGIASQAGMTRPKAVLGVIVPAHREAGDIADKRRRFIGAATGPPQRDSTETEAMADTPVLHWLLLIHHLPPEPAYLRVKIGRRMARVGAVALKNSVYVLPAGSGTEEDFQWIAKEIAAGGGEAHVCEARFLTAAATDELRERFREARTADYQALAEEARGIGAALAEAGGASPWSQARKDSQRLRRRLAEIVTIDFFDAPGRAAAEAALLGMEGRLRPEEGTMAGASKGSEPNAARAAYRGRTWVTRSDVHVDRMASAWLIRRFVDDQARFRFVADEAAAPAAGELRFDMFEAEFTHEGDNCTFEVLLARMELNDPALVRLGHIVHDLDLRDGKYGGSEVEGLGMLLDGVVGAHTRDEDRLARSGAIFDDLYQAFRTAAR